MKKLFPKNVETKRLIGSIPTLTNLNEYECMMQNKQFIDCYGVAFNKEEIYKLIISNINHWTQYGF